MSKKDEYVKFKHYERKINLKVNTLNSKIMKEK